MAGKKHSQPAMMRIAIAGAGGFGYILAQQIAQTAHAVLEHPEFEENLGIQVALVDYSNVNALQYTLTGVDVVISTIAGTEQFNLIDAARKARVRFFVPSEFEGALGHRPNGHDPLDRGTEATLDLLRRWSQSKSSRMEYTVFTCGIFYERFAPGGLATYNMGGGQPGGQPNQGDYLLDIGSSQAEIVENNAQGRPVQVSMISVYDVARFVAAAIELGPQHWPREYKMRGDQMTTREIVTNCSNARGVPFTLVAHPYNDLDTNINYYEEIQDWGRWHYFQRLFATANGRYNFRSANLNDAVAQSDAVDVRPMRFREWVQQVWGPAQ